MDNDIYIVWPLPFRGRNGGKRKKGIRNEKEGNYPYFVILFKIGPSLMTAIKVRKKNWEEYKKGERFQGGRATNIIIIKQYTVQD